MKRYSLMMFLSVMTIYGMEQKMVSSATKKTSYGWNQSWEKAGLFLLATTCFCCAEVSLIAAETKIPLKLSGSNLVDFNTAVVSCTNSDSESEFWNLFKIQAAARAAYLTAVACCFDHEKPNHSCCCSVAKSVLNFYCSACDAWTEEMGLSIYEDFDGVPGVGTQLLALKSVRVDAGKKRE